MLTLNWSSGQLQHLSDYDQLTGANMITYAMAGQSVTLVISLIGFFLLGTDPSSPA